VDSWFAPHGDRFFVRTDSRLVNSSTEHSTAIPWGDEQPIRLELPPDWPAPDVVVPNLDGPLEDYTAALVHALDHPEGGRRLEDGLEPGKKVAIVVDDPSRWTPVREALPIVLRRIEATGVARADISISVGVGRHHAVDDSAMRKRVGDAIVEAYACHSPPVDDLSQYVELGELSSGVHVRVFRPVAAADVRVLIGSVLPHLQAGFGGGYKLIFPGTSHRTTLGGLHRSGLGNGDASRLLGGDARENPMRRAIVEAAGLLPGSCCSISHLLGDPGQVFDVATGAVDRVQDRLANEARRRYQAPTAPVVDVVVAGNAPWPGDPMQSFKVLLNHRNACRKNGVLVGFFWTNPVEIDRSFPMTPMRLIAATGSPGGWVARRALGVLEPIISATSSPAAFMMRWARELVVDRKVLVFSPALRERLGANLGPIGIFDRQDELWSAASRALGRRHGPPSVRVFPEGGLTYCPQAETPI
jgi:lactate racemase